MNASLVEWFATEITLSLSCRACLYLCDSRARSCLSPLVSRRFSLCVRAPSLPPYLVELAVTGRHVRLGLDVLRAGQVFAGAATTVVGGGVRVCRGAR